MLKTIKTYKDLPFEEGKEYKLKFQTGERFLIKEIVWKEFKSNGRSEKRMVAFNGVYSNSPHLGFCPLNIDRLIPERIESGEVEVCEYCNK